MRLVANKEFFPGLIISLEKEKVLEARSSDPTSSVPSPLLAYVRQVTTKHSPNGENPRA